MGSKKTTQTTTNLAPQFVAQPKNPYYEQAKAMLDNLDYTSSVNDSYAQAANQISESGNEIFGADTSPEVAQKVRDSRLFRNTVDRGRDLSAAKQREIGTKADGYMSLGQATAPITYNPGGTTTQVQPFSWGNLISSAISGAASIGASAIGSHSSGGGLTVDASPINTTAIGRNGAVLGSPSNGIGVAA